MITTNADTLRNPSLDFDGTNEELKTLIALLEFELNSYPGKNKGVGLSAIQINIPFKVAIIRHKTKGYNLFNARVVKCEQPYTFKGEGCLSFPNQYINTTRYNVVEVMNGNGELLKFSGFEAAVVLHEIDHWFGFIYTDRKVEDEKD